MIQYIKKSALLSLAMLVLAAPAAQAQDTRKVEEPVVPQACAVLHASLRVRHSPVSETAQSRIDTGRIQAAIDQCKPGQAVELKADGAKNAFLSGPLTLRDGVTLLVDKGVTLYGSRNPRLYDIRPGGCGTYSPKGHECRPLISVNGAHNTAVMGEGTVDGQGDRSILEQKQTWWQLARAAHNAHQLQSCPRLIIADRADGFTLYKITLHNSGNFHVVVNHTNGFTAWGVHIQSPMIKGLDAPNTDGIDPSESSNITVTHSWIFTGDDNIAIKTGVHHMSVLDNHFYEGHGMSIGSGTDTGDSDLLVDGLTMDHTTSGIRVKSNISRGGLVHDLTYRNICMRDVEMPIGITPFYNNTPSEVFADPGFKGDKIPDYKKILIQNVKDENSGRVLIAGWDTAHITDVTFDGVTLAGLKPEQAQMQFAKITIGPAGTNIVPSGKGVTVEHASASAPATLWKNCDGKFLPMR